jgi:hypothetical protein
VGGPTVPPGADGNLTIQLDHLNIENPSIKAIEVLSYVPVVTTTSSTTTTTIPTTTTTLAPECFANADCADAEPCTADVCTDGQCDNPPANGVACSDGLFCNGADSCFGGSCSAHVGNPCTGPDADANCSESCNEAADDCTGPDPQGAACSDDVFCNGADVCDNGSCSSHAGDPCSDSTTCNEAFDACDACVSVGLPASIQCYLQRDCSVPVSLDTGGLSVSSVAATFAPTSDFECGSACLAGAAASNGTCAVEAATCEFDVTDTIIPVTAFANGEAATLTVRCTEEATSQACLSSITATQPDLAPAAACGDECVPFSCGACLSGDCNANGSIDAGDPICTVLCLIGQAPVGADCSCASDCNCLQGTEAGDPVCAVRRLIGSFTPDTCSAPLSFVSMIGDGLDMFLATGAARPLPDATGFRVPLRLRGDDAHAVGALYTQLSSDATIRRVRLVRRLRNAGFALNVGRSGDSHVALVVLPPFEGAEIPPIAGGRVARITLRGHSPIVSIGQTQYGSTEGLPLLPRR